MRAQEIENASARAKKGVQYNDEGSELMSKLSLLLENNCILLFAKLLHVVGADTISLLVISLEFFSPNQDFNLLSVAKRNIAC